MATGFSTSIANAVLEHVVGKTDIGALGAPYLALSSTKPTDTGTNITEPSGGNYARVACSGATWGTAASRAIANASTVTFPTSNAAWLAGATLGYWVLMSASSGGTMVAWGTVANPPSVAASGATPSFAAGQLTFSVTTTV